MKWITNQPKAISDIELTAYWNGNRQAYNEWRSQFTEGRPQATEELTVEQLEKYGMIGLYEVETS